jgi:thiamine pyrophosphate-dependent acetolactate synthase large subunit-like protein
VRLIEEAARPLIIAGWGAKEQGDNLLKLAERIKAPIVTTFRAKGVVPEDYELSFLAKEFPIEINILGDCGLVLEKLEEKVKEREDQTLVETVRIEKEKWYAQLEREAESEASPLKAPFIFNVLRGTIDQDAIITIDVGDNGFFGQAFKTFPKKCCQ